MLNCPLCDSSDLELIQLIDRDDIINLYIKKYNFDVTYLFHANTIKFLECNYCNLKFFYPNVTGDETFYNFLQGTPDYYAAKKQEYDFCKQFFNKRQSVLEIGCGTGNFSRIIEYESYLGLETSKNAVETAVKAGINVINKSVQEYKSISNSKFDIICAFQVLEHVVLEDIRSFLESAIDLLKDEGLLIISVPADDSFVGYTSNLVLNLPPHHVTRWTDSTLIKFEKLFQLKRLFIFNDNLRKININAFMGFIINNFLNINNKIVVNKFIMREKVVNLLIRMLSSTLKEKIAGKLNARGHSITVIYKKI